MRKKTFAELFAEQPDLETLKKLPRLPMICILENIRSMYNVGSIFRTADAVRVAELYLAGYTPVPPRKEIDKTALGATESVPWQHFDNARAAVEQARKKGYSIWVLEQTAGGEDLLTLEVKEPVALVLGNEVWGISDDIVKMADRAVELPMLGHKQSLNVSVAFGVAVYSLYNQYVAKGDYSKKG